MKASTITDGTDEMILSILTFGNEIIAEVKVADYERKTATGTHGILGYQVSVGSVAPANVYVS